MTDDAMITEDNAVTGGPDITRRCVTEAIGTFILVFTIVAAVATQSPLAPLGIGSALMVMIFAGGHISGAHFNPAVTVAVWLRGKTPTADVVPYVVSQLAGAAVAALIGKWMFSDTITNAPSAFSGKDIWVALVVEFIFTFALAFVVLNVATSRDHPNNHFYGLAIGFTVLAGAVSVGSLSGGAFNPAVAFGISIASLTSWGNIWIYLLAELAGAAVAASAFKYLNPDDI